jgi:hypothetical protein
VVLPVIVSLLPETAPALGLVLLVLQAATAQAAAMTVPTARACRRMTSTP